MKTILIILICAIGLTAFGQLKDVHSTSTHGTVYPLSYFTISNDSLIRIADITQSDTLVIKDISIHFIKIGDKVFEIKRNVELVPVVEHPSVAFPKWRAVTLDSMITRTPYNHVSPRINN